MNKHESTTFSWEIRVRVRILIESEKRDKILIKLSFTINSVPSIYLSLLSGKSCLHIGDTTLTVVSSNTDTQDSTEGHSFVT